MAHDPTGLLIIRARLEDGASRPLRAHVSMTDDVGDGIQREHDLADIDAVCRVVREWLTVITAG